MDEIGEAMIKIFNHVERYKCLCEFTTRIEVKDLWNRMYQCNLKQKDLIKEENQLLCTSFMRLLGEISISSKNNRVCAVIDQLFEIFLSEDLWNTFIYHLKSSEEKYLIWTLIKSFSNILYACNETTFSKRIHELLNNVKGNLFAETNILDFLSSLIDYNIKPSVAEIEIITCRKTVSSTAISFKDLFQSLGGLLAAQWPSFIKQFHDATTTKSENQSINRFLILWQRLVEKYREQHLFHTFLSEEFVIAFLFNAYNLNIISLRIYVDIIMQFFTSSVKSKSLGKNCCDSLDSAIASALDNNFLNLLPQDLQISGFCILPNLNHCDSASKSDFTNFQKCDPVIVKKVTYILLNLIVDVKDRKLLFYTVPKIFDFVKQNFNILPEADVYTWILDVFIDQDDILLGVMFALLRIHTILKEEDSKNFSQCSPLQNSLNPHGIFISFLERIGFDHNELLSFLISDETCFLLYLLHYLKLLLKEWDSFIKAHNDLIKTDEDMFELVSTHKTDEESSINYSPPTKKLLVSYSSSSSEENLQTVSYVPGRNQSVTTKCNFVVISTLIKLRDGIQKLVDAKEFPYTVSPLIALLQACENNFLSL